MTQAISFIVTFSVTQLIFLALRQRFKIKELEEEKERMKHSNLIFENMYRNQISLLQGQVDRLLKMKSRGNYNVSDDTIQAVKYAMKKSHPDNGGNAEDFMRFQKVYEELTRR